MTYLPTHPFSKQTVRQIWLDWIQSKVSTLTTTGSPLVHKTLTEFDFMSPCTYNKQTSKKALRPCYTEKETFFILRLKDVWRERR